MRRFLIVNADDFGLSVGTNQGIIEAHERGIVTSASLMVRQPAAAEAAVYAHGRPQLSVGLHVDLGEWVYRAGEWHPAYEVIPTDDLDAVSAEVARQLQVFRQLMGRPPTHLDSHQHVHKQEPARSVLLALAQELDLPLRHCSPAVAFCGDFYGQGHKGVPYPGGVSVRNLLAILAKLPPGVSELCCHPGLDRALDSSYCAERCKEVKTLCDPRVRGGLEALGVQLLPFGALPKA
ncbi:MAG: hypothetical protein QOE70_1289 [Chthoniobacter sp.]|nr:hypothetical protein [Chthoniobacter sp.]